VIYTVPKSQKRIRAQNQKSALGADDVSVC